MGEIILRRLVLKKAIRLHSMAVTACALFAHANQHPPTPPPLKRIFLYGPSKLYNCIVEIIGGADNEIVWNYVWNVGRRTTKLSVKS